MSEKQKITLTVNGVKYIKYVPPRKLLVDLLRDDLELLGTHAGCEHGVCGSCTILYNGKTARSCLMFAVQANGAEIMTVEGLATNGNLHPIQQSFHDLHGLQCGYCTPGMLMTAYEFLKENPSPTEEETREAMAGVLCRCTGYKQVIDSVMDAAGKIQNTGG